MLTKFIKFILKQKPNFKYDPTKALRPTALGARFFIFAAVVMGITLFLSPLDLLAMGDPSRLNADLNTQNAASAYASIGDIVWIDANGNGKQDDGSDVGLGSVVIKLWQDDGDGVFEPAGADALLGTQSTAENGGYHFASLGAGAYWVGVDESSVDAGWIFSPGVESGPNPRLVNLQVGQEYTAADFGYAGRGSIIGTVWLESVRVDGTHGLGEPGIPDAQICLYADPDNQKRVNPGDTPLSCMSTDDQGNYAFGSLAPGNYVVVESPVAGMVNTTPTMRAVALIIYGAFGVSSDNDFGHVAYSSITGAVFIDSNGNGTRNTGETIGLSGIPVTATSTNSGEAVTAYTDALGQYEFSGLLAGEYSISAPMTWPGLARTTPAPVKIYLSAAQTYTGMEFGYISPTAVQMRDFVAQRSDQGIVLKWSTAAESELQGFKVWRAVGPYATYKPISGLIPALNQYEGADYVWSDTTVSPDGEFWYKLQVLPDNEFFGAVSVQPDPGASKTYLYLPNMLG